MSNAIGFLETVGQDSALRVATKEELESALSELQIDPQIMKAVIANDTATIGQLLGAKPIICCGVLQPEPGKEDDEEEEEPSKEDEIRSTLMADRAA